jgi:uncharacterized protein
MTRSINRFNPVFLAGLMGLAAALPAVAADSAASAPAKKPAVAGSAASESKKALVAKVVALHHQGIESMARALVEQPAGDMQIRANMFLREKVPAGPKRDTAAKDVKAEVEKYHAEVVPEWQKKAVALAPETVGPILEQNFDEKELKALIAWLESPLARKYNKISPDLQKALAEKLAGEMRTALVPRLNALQQAVGKRLEAATAAPAASAAAPAASK